MSTPVTHTRAVPVVRAKNTHASHASCSATRTTVTVMRLRMRLKNLTIGNRNSIPSPLSVFLIRLSITRFFTLCKFLVSGAPELSLEKKFTGASADAPVNRNHSIIFSAQTVGASLSS